MATDMETLRPISSGGGVDTDAHVDEYEVECSQRSLPMNGTDDCDEEERKVSSESSTSLAQVRATATAAAPSDDGVAIPASPVYQSYQAPSNAAPSSSSRGCGCLPHGGYPILPALCSTIAWLACISKSDCEYARVTGPIVEEITNNPAIPYIDVGYKYFREPVLNTASGEWDVSLGPACEALTSSVPIDFLWKFSRMTSFMGLVLGGGGTIFLWFSLFFAVKKGVWRWAGYELLAATIFQAFSYSWFRTSLCQSNSCTLNYGARVDIMACYLWASATFCVFCKYPLVRSKIGYYPRQPPVQLVQFVMSSQSEIRPPETVVVAREIT